MVFPSDVVRLMKKQWIENPKAKEAMVVIEADQEVSENEARGFLYSVIAITQAPASLNLNGRVLTIKGQRPWRFGR